MSVTANLAALAYLISGVLFILALRGLSSPVTSRRGNLMGMTGMAIAVAVTLVLLLSSGDLDGATLLLIAVGVAIGGSIGAVIARRVPMTSMPQLVAAFHSLVGLAACLVATAAIYTPVAYHIDDPTGVKLESLIELSVGLAIGAITFTGSLIAFAKLNGNMSGAPILLPARHLLNLALAAAIVVLIVLLSASAGHALWAFWSVLVLALVGGVTLIIPIGGADMPVVISMLNSYSGWAAAALGFTLGNITLIITGALVGSSGAILSYIMCKGMNSLVRVGDPGRLRRRRRRSGRTGGDPSSQAGLGRGRRLHPEERVEGDHRPWLRHGRGPGPACAARNGRPPEGRGGGGEIRHPSGGRAHAGAHERAAGRSQCPL